MAAQITIPYEILGSIVEELRSWKRDGERLSKILERLWPANDRLDLMNHLRIAFCEDSLPNPALFPKNEKGMPRPDLIDEYFEPPVEATRPIWINAPPYPDLYRRRDRHVFRAVAAAHRAYILVKAVDRRAARFIGRAGYRPCPPGLPGYPRTEAPNAGLLAADQFAAALVPAGYRVSDRESGRIIHDDANQAFYPAYDLIGVYSEDGANLYDERGGESLRAELNLRLGEDLVQQGPRDCSACREENPILPVLIFEPDGNVDVRQTPQQLKAYYLYRGLPWKKLYGTGI